MYPRIRKNHKGSSLVEVLISLLLFSIALLGLMRMTHLAQQTLKTLTHQQENLIDDNNQREKNLGFTFVEMLISILLSSFLLIATYHLFALETKITHEQEVTLQLQQDSQLVEEQLSQFVYQAGYFGCHTLSTSTIHSDLTSNTLLDRNSPIPVHFPNAIYALHSNSIDIPQKLRAQLKPDSDVLILSGLIPNDIYLMKPMAKANSSLQVNRIVTFNVGDVLAIGDCNDVDLFAVTRLSTAHPPRIEHKKSSLNSTGNFSKVYQKNSLINQFDNTVIYLKKSDDSDETGYSLYENNTDLRDSAVIDNVKNFTVSFGQINSPTQFNFPENDADWSKIRLVKIEVTFMRSKQTLSQTYIFSLRNA